MRILGICGSLAKDSVNLKYLMVVENLLREGISFEVQTLHKIPMYSPDITIQPEAVKLLCEKIAVADRIIFAVPEYNYSVPGVFKNAIDWISRDSSQPLNSKIAAIIGASPGTIGTARSQYHLRQIGVFLNIRFINKPEVMISACHDKIDQDGKITDQNTLAHIKSMVEALIATT